MNLFNKVNQLLKYCGQYHGHTHMMDERTNGDDFNIKLAEEYEIEKNIEILKFILLTGEAGDGKSRILRNLNPALIKNNFEICEDYSAIDENEKRKIIKDIYDIIFKDSNKKIIVAANIGIFTKTVLMYERKLLEILNKPNDKIKLVNFEKRNLASDIKNFYHIIHQFLKYDEGELCTKCDCPFQNNCNYKRNIDFLLTQNGMESVRVLVDTICLTGGHITFREFLSLLAYIVTFGQDCKQRISSNLSEDKYSYIHIFDATSDLLLHKISMLDPAKKRGKIIEDKNIENCIMNKRSDFFKEEGDKYRLLFLEYLSEFREALNYINNTWPYYFDSEKDKNKTLYCLKRGLSKITKRGQTDVSMTIGDTPTMFDDSIQTEFNLDSIEIVWNRYDINFNNLDNKHQVGINQNRFYLSYIYHLEDKEEVQAISMLIDYDLFCYLMRADQDYFLHRSSLSMEEYSINTFYRKILKTKPESYYKMHVKFNEWNKKDSLDFYLELKEKNSTLFGKQKTIKIKKEA